MANSKPSNFSALGPVNVAFAEAMYENYLRDASSVPPDWQRYFC
jgi:2-oxoglutarate dehydrogenase complex dehydrogenase (E1) component-like enzyme